MNPEDPQAGVDAVAAHGVDVGVAPMEELEKEDELAFAGDGGLVVPLGMESASGGIHRPAARRGLQGGFALTRRVSRNQGRGCFHALDNNGFNAPGGKNGRRCGTMSGIAPTAAVGRGSDRGADGHGTGHLWIRKMRFSV